MKNTMNWKFGLGAAGLCILSGAFLVPQNTPASAQNLAPIPVLKQRGMEKHPEIRKAIRNLEQAKTNLTNAAHDFDGHREKALDLTNQALAECRLALKADK